MDASAFSSQLDSFRAEQDFVSAPADGRVAIENLSFRSPFDSLYEFLVDSGLIVPVS